jgi:Icc-related predicted phosphoesterase
MKNKPSIYFCGDVHGKFDHIISLCNEEPPDAIILLGDIQAQRPLHKELAHLNQRTQVWWIHGNHDTDSQREHDYLFGSKLADRNLHGRVVDICGVRVAGLGGVFRGQIWRPPEPANYASEQAFVQSNGLASNWRCGLPLKHGSSIFPSDVHADILVTHEGPSMHRFGFTVIDELATNMQVKKLFHGHQHEDIHYPKASIPTEIAPAASTWQAFGVGLRGVMDLDGAVLLPGQHDQPYRDGLL